MQTFAKTPRQETSKERGGSAQQSQSAESSSLRGLMALQRTAGNAAVGQLLRGAIAKAKAEQEAPETQAESDRESERAPIPRGERDRQRERKENPSGTENGIEQGVLQSEQASPPAEVSGSLPASEGPIATDRATVGGSDNQFVSLTQAPASDIVQRIHGGFANDLKDEFASVRLASAERAPVLRVSLPGDDLAPAKPKAPAPSKLPSADRIAVPEGNAEDNLAAEETAVPLQPEGDAVQTSVGIAPRIRFDGAADPGHANAAVTQAGSLGHEISSQVGAEISEAATAAKIRRVGVEREETLEFADSSQSPAIQASTEMLEYLATDVPPNVRQMADDDFGPVLEQVLSPARQKVEQATTDRDTQRDQAFAEVVEQTEAASKKANEQQQQAVSDGYDQISAEKQKGLEEGQQTLDTFDAEVKNRHTAHQDEINTQVQTEQEKADEAIRKGEEDARKEEEKAREEERITREEAERDRPEKPKKKWYQKVGDWFKNAIKSWTDKLVGAVKAVFNKAKELVSKVLTFAKNVAVGIIRSLKKFVVAAIKTLATGLKILVNGLLIAFPKLRARVNAAIDGVVEATVSAVETIAQNLEQTVTAAIDRVESTVNRVLDFCEMVIVTQIEIVSAILSGEFLNAAKYLFLAACKAVGIPGEEFLDILADARDGLMDIIKRPAKFLGYMIKSVGQGMKNFFSHFPQRMVAGLTGWLFGQVAQGGITIAKSFDLKSIFVLLIQVMGFTYDYIRAKVISLVGEKAVSVIEQVMTPIRILFTEGPGALWKWLADKAQDAKDAIVEAASQWLITKIIQQAAIKLATMFTPVGAFVQAVLMMYNTIMFFVEKIKEIFAWVKSITSSIKTIATGAISAAANYIDQAMSKSIPLIITFLAKLMGIDGISEKIRQVVTKLRTPVDKAISFVVENLIKIAKAAWGGIKKGATAVKDAVVSWWSAEAKFTTRDGHNHRLFFDGEGSAAVLMVASDKKTVDSALNALKEQELGEQDQLNKIEAEKYKLDAKSAKEESSKTNTKAEEVGVHVNLIAARFAELRTLDVAMAKELLPCAKDGPTASKLAAAAIDDLLKLSPERFRETYGASIKQYEAFMRAYKDAQKHQMFANQPDRPDYDIIDSNGEVMKYSEFERRALLAKLDVARAPFAAVGYVIASAFTDDENKRMAGAGLGQALGGIAEGVAGVATSRQMNRPQIIVPKGTIKAESKRLSNEEKGAPEAAARTVEKKPPSQLVGGKEFHEKQEALLSQQLSADSEVTLLSPGGGRSRVDSLVRVETRDQHEFISVSLKSRNWNRLLGTLDRKSQTARLDHLEAQVRADVKELLDKYSGIREVRSKTADQVSHGKVITVADVVLTYNSGMLHGVIRGDLIEAWSRQAFQEMRSKYPELRSFTITFESGVE